MGSPVHHTGSPHSYSNSKAEAETRAAQSDLIASAFCPSQRVHDGQL